MTFSVSDLIALVSALVATLALFISIYAARMTRQVATSGFQSAERVKLDTANLLSALRGLMIKGALYTQQDPKIRDDKNSPIHISIDPERTAIQTFLSSSTALAYYAFVSNKSKMARDAGRKGEEWRIFFLYLVQLLQRGNLYEVGKLAGKVEKMFDGVTSVDIEEMSAGLQNLPRAIRKILEERQYDVLLHVLVDMQDEKRQRSFEDFVAFLRNQGIKDPDVDLFWSAIDGSVELAQDALGRGAKVNVTEGEIKTRYKELWNQFNSAKPAGQDSSTAQRAGPSGELESDGTDAAGL